MIFLGIDLGTTGVKLVALSDEGKVLFKHFEGYNLYTPKPGWSEEVPAEWWKAILKSLKAVSDFLGRNSTEVKALALSGQMHGSVFLDNNGKVIRPAILWNDTRTIKQRKEIESKIGKEELLKKVQNLPLEGFTAPKILWLKENEPENYSKLWKVILPKDYINYKLTNRICTEPTDASGTALYDVIGKKWSNEIIEKIGLHLNIFPEVVKSTEAIGKISKEVSRETGINKECLVIAGGADNVCGAVGAGVADDGQMLISIGSSGVVFLPVNNPMKRDPKGRLHFFNHVENLWYNMGVTLSAGLSLKWFRETFEKHGLAEQREDKNVYDFMLEKAKKVSLGSEGLYYLPYLNGERTPYMDAKARGIFLGFSLRHKEEHFIRSVLEGVAYSLKDSLEIAKKYGLKVKEAKIIGGGAKSELWTQIITDVLNVNIDTLMMDEGPAFGAGILAAVGSGVYSTVQEAMKTMVKTKRTFKPISGNVEEYGKRYDIYKSIYRANAAIMSKSFDIERETTK
ncbi:xylulokinase [Mesoaciditoga lauensis]|uniref:xylulokinase n=1 Tax=Mesoaciditoga lauensis TaxID=1495039 RepID=UPI000559FF97|nr:xylulokinase [Mesoaciditoga lauensis]